MDMKLGQRRDVSRKALAKREPITAATLCPTLVTIRGKNAATLLRENTRIIFVCPGH